MCGKRRPAETAKEVKVFGLIGLLIDRYLRLATDFYATNRRLAVRRAGWGGLFTAIGTVGYYRPMPISSGERWRALLGRRSHLSRGIVQAPAQSVGGLLAGFSTTAGQALYLNDLFSFYEIEPRNYVASKSSFLSRARRRRLCI